MKLYEIDKAILECVDQETGEIIDTEKLSELQMQKDTKVENIALWIKDLLAEADAIKNEKNKLAERQKTAENKATSLKKYLEYVLSGDKFKTPKVSISYRKSESVTILNGCEIPKKYLKYSEPTIDKLSIKKAIKDGEKVPGVELTINQNIQIK